MEYVVNWENDGAELKAFKNPQTGKLASRPQNQQVYIKSIGCTWSTISSGKASFRYFDKGWLFETKGSVCFPNDESNNNVIMGYLNSALVNPFLEVFSPTMDYHEGPVGELPYKEIQSKPIDNLVAKNIAISKQDWDAHETSWDFAQNELIALNNNEAYTSVVYESAEQDGCVVDLAPAQLGNLAWLIDIYKLKWETKFEQLHKNEEELNRQFIDIYGLQDELSPDVPLDEITILQQGEISIE